MLYRSPRSHPANCRLPRSAQPLRPWRIALAAGLALLAALCGIAYGLIGRDLARVAAGEKPAAACTAQYDLMLQITELAAELYSGNRAVEAPLRAAIGALERRHVALMHKTILRAEPGSDLTGLYYGGPQPLDRSMRSFLTATRRFAVAPDTEAGQLAFETMQGLARETLAPQLARASLLIGAKAEQGHSRLLSLQIGAGLAALLFAVIAVALVLKHAVLKLRRLVVHAATGSGRPAAPPTPPTVLVLNGRRWEIGRGSAPAPEPAPGKGAARAR